MEKTKSIRNFSRYGVAIEFMAVIRVHVSKKEWDVTNRILEMSGEAFSQCFPDAK